MKYKLEDISLKISKGSTPRGKVNYSSDENNLFLRVTDLNELQHIETAEYTLSDDDIKKNKMKIWPSNTVLVSIEGTVGKVAMLKKRMAFNQAIAGIIPDEEKVIPEYLMYYLRQTPTISSILKGTIMPALRLGDLSSIELDLPDLITQQKIVRILSALDQKIELINCENCTIENTLQSYFNNWIDNIKPIATVGLDEIAKYTNGLAMQKFRPGSNDLGLPVVKIKEMNSGISKDTERCTSELKEEYTVFPGDVLFAWSGTLCMKIWDGEVAGLNQHIFKVTSDEYPKWFYYFWTKKHLERFINIAKGKATTMGHIQRKELSLSKVLIPSEHELKKQDEIFRPLIEKIICNNSQRQSLLNLRDTLLPKLMSGEIKI